MSEAFIAHLQDRGVVAVAGADAVKFLNGLATNELGHLQAGEPAHAGLLSPQGKILFDFIAVRTADGFLLDAPHEMTAGLAKRLAMYKLRAAVSLSDVSERFTTLALWGGSAVSCGETRAAVSFRDPRHAQLGWRILAEREFAQDIAAATNGTDVPAQAYHAHRIALGVPEGGKDYDFGDAYPHEADFDLFHGLSFKKGCYVGQEVVSRMQHKTIVRKRVVRVTAGSDLTAREAVMQNGAVIGRIGSIDGRNGLALIRLDRFADATRAGDAVVAGDVRIAIHEQDLQRYLQSIEAR